jgi:hypothetical protein
MGGSARVNTRLVSPGKPCERCTGAARLKRRAGFPQEVCFFSGRFPSENCVAMGKAPESGDDIAMAQCESHISAKQVAMVFRNFLAQIHI